MGAIVKSHSSQSKKNIAKVTDTSKPDYKTIKAGSVTNCNTLEVMGEIFTLQVAVTHRSVTHKHTAHCDT